MIDSKIWFVGVDWASENHHVRISDCHGKRIGERVFAHGGAGLAEMAAWLSSVTNGEPSAVHVAIEVPHGPVVETLLERGFKVYAINPKQLDRFRDRFSPAGAKDDSRDAEVLADALRTDMRAFRKLALAEPLLIELREWSRLTDDLTAERNRLANRMREQLWRYFPAMLDLEDDVAAEWFLDLWELVPTPDKAARTRESSIAKLLKSRRIRRLDVAQVLAALRKPAVFVAPGTIEAATAHIQSLIERIRLVNRQIKEAHSELDRLCAKLAEPMENQTGETSEQRDAAILASLPGNGRIVLATLLAECWEPLQRRDYHALRTLCGAAPVTKRSGKSRIVTRRLACNPRLSKALYHWARVAVQHDARSRAKYSALRQRGHSHGRALRSVGDRLLNVACAMLRNRTPFNPSLPSQSLLLSQKSAC
jgi:transposase